MNILFLSINGKNDTRTRAFIRVLRSIGDLTCVTKLIDERTPDVESTNDIVFEYNGIKDLPKFVRASVEAAKQMKTVDILFLDNRMPSIPYYFIRKYCTYVVQDAREFYSLRDTHHLVGKIGCIIEQHTLRKVDKVICANEQRAELMRMRFKLKQKPFVYQNIFPSEYDIHFNRSETEEKYGMLFQTHKKVLVSSAGCQIQRTTDKLVLAMKSFQDEAVLLLVGGASLEDERRINDIIVQNQISNVICVGHVDTNTLKYLMEKSDVGVVIYGKHDQNNRYCASGKIYEYLYEKLPILTCANEPLVAFCNSTGTGYATDNYVQGINEMIHNVCSYKDKAIEFYSTFDPHAGDRSLMNELLKRTILNKGAMK